MKTTLALLLAANAGDVDGDGRDDVLVGAPGGDGFIADSGYVDLLSGLDGSLIRRFNGFQTGQRYGEALAAGPLDNSLPPWEVAIGAPAHDLDDTTGGTLEEGFVYIHRLSDASVIKFLPGTDFELDNIILGKPRWERRRWGDEILFVGDEDGNGFGELVISAPFSHRVDANGAILDANTGFVRGFEPFDDVTGGADFGVLGFTPGDFVGRELVNLGLAAGLSGDDFAISRPGEGEVLVYSVPFDLLGLAGGSIVTTIDAACIDGFTSLGAVGDLDFDGFTDIAVGVSGAGAAGLGSVCLFKGFNGALLEILEGDGPGDRFGTAVAGADFNGDGSAEVIVGIPRDDTNAPDAGAATVFTGVSCLTEAAWENYGSGLPGTLGVPDLTSAGLPLLGSNFVLDVENAAGANVVAFAFLGFAPASVGVKGGTLLVDAFLVKQFVLPLGGASVPFFLADEPSFCGLELYLQVIHVDAGAILGAAFTPGMKFTLGL